MKTEEELMEEFLDTTHYQKDGKEFTEEAPPEEDEEE